MVETRRDYARRDNFFRGKFYIEARDCLQKTAESLETDTLKVIETRTGRGLEARRVIKAGETIFCAQGDEIELPEEEDGYFHTEGELKGWWALGNVDSTYPNAICVDREKQKSGNRVVDVNVWLNPEPENPLRYLNHSCEPNVGRAGPFIFKAMHDIQPGEQIVTDYAILEPNPIWKMKCNCGSAHCRGEISSIQSLPLELAERYWQYIPKFMQEIYLEHARKIFTQEEDRARVDALASTKNRL